MFTKGETYVEDVILQKYQVRKSNKQKTEFIEYLKGRLAESGYDADKDITIESKGNGGFLSRNIVVGNPENAKVYLTAHYDTCAVLPFPNLMAPTNPVLFLGYQLVVAVFLILIAGLVAFPFHLIFHNPLITYYGFLGGLFLLLYQLMFGYRNKHTANDNTSGVIVLTKILEKLPQEYRNQVCVVYFDNEEKGLFGSAFFAKKHKKAVKDRLLINIDCVGDGKEILSMAKKKARADAYYPLFVEVMQKCSEEFDGGYLCQKMKPMMFPSDQSNFDRGIGICAVRKSPVGRYVARIHTPLDTRCRKENIEYLAEAFVTFLQKVKDA